MALIIASWPAWGLEKTITHGALSSKCGRDSKVLIMLTVDCGGKKLYEDTRSLTTNYQGFHGSDLNDAMLVVCLDSLHRVVVGTDIVVIR
jgi:hypothetical protein